MEKVKNFIWSIIGILIIVFLILFTGKKGTKILNNLDEKQKQKEEEVKNDLKEMSDIGVIFKYGNIESAQRIINEGRNKFSNTARTLLSGLGRKGVCLQDTDRNGIGHLGDGDKDSS